LGSETQDVAETLRALGQHWQADPGRREEVEDRLQLLRRLETKYGKTIDDLIEYRATLDQQEAHLEQQERDRPTVEGELAASFARLRSAGAELSKQRQRVAKRLASAIQKELADLGMAEARLDAVLQAIPLGDDPIAAEIPSHGLDQLELTLAANRG